MLVPFAVALLLAADPSAGPAAAAGTEARIHGLLEQGRWTEALSQARSLQAAAPQDPRALSLLGEALFRAGKLDEVETVLGALDGDPAAPGRALMTLGRLRDAQGRGADAVRLMRLAVSVSPDDPELLFQAADAVETRAEAAKLLERYLELSPDANEDRLTEARGRLRVFEALGERAVWVSVTRPEALELPLSPLWVPQSGQVVGYTIDARLDEQGKPVRLLLDSGSTTLFVLERVARKHAFEPVAGLTVFDGGGSGRHATTRGFFPSFRLGELAFDAALASAAKVEIDPQGRYHGVVGLSVFNGYRLTLDLAGRRVLLEREAPALSEAVPYYTIYGQMLVEVAVDGERGLFLLDTGATNTAVADSFVERLPGARVGEAIDLPAYGGSRRGARQLRGVEIRFPGTAGATPALSAVDLSLRSQVGGVEISGFLGLDLLGGKRIEVDTVRRMVRVR